MKLKKLIGAVTSGVLTVGMLSAPIQKIPFQNSGISEMTFGGLTAEPIRAQAVSNFRRVVDNEHPMWIVHIDSWNYADPEKIIELVPEDVLPYVVFNISLSINWSSTEHKWLMVQDGIECARSWMKACADKGVWTMIQPASGGQCHFPDYKATDDLDNTIFGEFFKEYPNFIGYNYCEQFWGFASPDFPVTYQQRYDHFSALLKLCNKYGGYLDVSWCENQWGSALNPVAMLKTNANWEKACREYSENFILEEKYTQTGYIADVESEVYGAYISGYCGNYGVRWDDTGWSDYPWSGEATKEQYRLSTALPILTERMIQNGMTVVDGPELVWADCVKGLWDATDSEGYKVRQWTFFDQFQNDFLDLYRKFNEGFIRIPTRQEVIDRTKLVIIQDVNSGSNDDKYCTYPTLFEGLYRATNDGNLKDNHNPFKSTGRYQTIPTIYGFADNMAKSIPVQIKQSQIASRWSSISAKQAEFNKLYPNEAVSNCYVGRNQNTWITYNPNKTGGVTGGMFTLKYNTCKTFDIKHQLYGTAVIKEFADHIDIYMNNYDEDNVSELKTETIKIEGASSKPTFTAKDRGISQTKSVITESWENGTYILTVNHNGPVDISVKCSGNETGRSTVYPESNPTAPAFPAFYTGIRQYEGENFDMKNIEENITNGCKSGISKYWGMGFVKFGTKETAAVKDTVRTSKAGSFKWILRYSAVSDINSVDLYVNGSKVKTLSLPKGANYSDWKTITETISLKAGENTIELKANSALPSSLYLDNFRIDGDFGEGSPVMTPLNGTLIRNLLVSDAENSADWSIEEDFISGSQIFGDRNIKAVDVPARLAGTEYIRTACDSKMYEKDLASFTAGADVTVYTAVDVRVVPVLPEWLNHWEKTEYTLTAENDLNFILYKQNFKSGETITLGRNGGNGNNTNYLVFVKPEEKILNGTLIQNLSVYDTENAPDWSIESNFGKDTKLFGDRDLTCTALPSGLEGAEYIRTACDSKLSTENLAEMKAGKAMTVFVAVDTRVTPLPTWLRDWNNTGTSLSTSNDLTMTVYSRTLDAGETLILGTDGGLIESVNYVVLAKEGTSPLIGDVNKDGEFNTADVILLQKWLHADPNATLADWKAGDFSQDGRLNIYDLCLMKRLLLNR